MTPVALVSRIVTACEGSTSTQAGDRRRAVSVIYWLQTVAAAEEGLTLESERNATRRRAVLRRALIIPAENPYRLADACEALGVGPGDAAAIERVGWALRGATGQLSRANFGRAFAPLLTGTARELRYRRLPEFSAS